MQQAPKVKGKCKDKGKGKELISPRDNAQEEDWDEQEEPTGGDDGDDDDDADAVRVTGQEVAEVERLQNDMNPEESRLLAQGLKTYQETGNDPDWSALGKGFRKAELEGVKATFKKYKAIFSRYSDFFVSIARIHKLREESDLDVVRWAGMTAEPINWRKVILFMSFEVTRPVSTELLVCQIRSRLLFRQGVEARE